MRPTEQRDAVDRAGNKTPERAHAPRLASDGHRCSRADCCDDTELVHVIREGADYRRAPAVMGHLAACEACQGSYRDINQILALGAENRLHEAVANPSKIVAVVRQAVRRRRREMLRRRLPARCISAVSVVGAGTFLIGALLFLAKVPSVDVQSASTAVRIAVGVERGGQNVGQRVGIAWRCFEIGVDVLFSSTDAATVTARGTTTQVAKSDALATPVPAPARQQKAGGSQPQAGGRGSANTGPPAGAGTYVSLRPVVPMR